MAAADGSAPRLEIRSDRLLLVEGRDEVNLFDALLKHCFGATGKRIQVVDGGGKDRFPQRILAIQAAAAGRSPLLALGVVRDADNNAGGAFQSVCYALRHAGYAPPQAHGGISSGNPPVGVFILPDGTSTGAIETLCRRSVAGDAVSPCVEDYIECLKAQGALRSRNEDKTFAHAYLAAGADPVARVGEGAQQGAWDFNSDAFAEITAFIRKLP